MSGEVLLTITPEAIARHRLVLLWWIDANGIDPTLVPIDHPISVEQVDGRTVICYREYQLSADGHKLIDPDDPHRVLTVHRTNTQHVSLATVAAEQLLADIATAAQAPPTT